MLVIASVCVHIGIKYGVNDSLIITSISNTVGSFNLIQHEMWNTIINTIVRSNINTIGISHDTNKIRNNNETNISTIGNMTAYTTVI